MPNRKTQSVPILAAAVQLIGAELVVEKGEELTAEVIRQLGLDPAELAALTERGFIVEVMARAAEPVAGGETKALAAAQQRAREAESQADALQRELAAQQQQNTRLTAELAAATAPAADRKA